jgi:hypothetical protein
MLKRATDKSGYVHRDSIKSEIEQAKKYAIDDSEMRVTRLTNELNEIKKNVGEFEKASGVYLNRIESDHFWGDAEKMGKIYKLLHDAGGIESIKEQLLRMEGTAKDILEKISNSLKSI